MSTRNIVIGGVVVVVAAVAAVLGFVWISGGSGEASGETVSEELEAGAAEQSVFRINQEVSEARFIIYEELRGEPLDVVGATSDIAGDVLIDFANPTASELGAIRINLRTLATDNEFRNRAIRGQILRSAEDAYEFTDFVPTSIEGLPETVAVGDEITFSVTGDLTLVDTTQPVTFDVTVTVVSEEQLTGVARGQVLYPDFGISIPEVTSVANVADEVRLEFDFTADLVVADDADEEETDEAPGA